MKKRGPDFQNYTIEKFGNKSFALLHSRLAIIDLQSSANQPLLIKIIILFLMEKFIIT